MNAQYSKLHRLFDILVGPNQKTEDKTHRQLSVLLYSFQLAIIPFAILTILSGDLVIGFEFLSFAAVAAILSLYVITKIVDYRVAVRLVLSLYTLVPILIWFSVTIWEPSDVPRIMPWIIIALALGALFADERVVIVQGILIEFTMIFVVGFIRNVPLSEYDSHLITVAILSMMVIIFSRLIGSYLAEIERQAAELERRNNDLEIYTRLLRHDLSNDLQAIINSVELSQMLLPINTDNVNENLEQSLNFSMRMQKLLDVFRMPLEQPSTNLVEDIKKIARESEKTHGNLSIAVSCTIEAEKATITAGRLLPLVWTNIFRNASQHAGEHPVVKVDISIVNHSYRVLITDDGPGIPQEKKEKLFRRNSDLEQKDRGIGLYLSKLIIESHGGTMKISDTSETQFIFEIPTSSSR